MKIEKIKKNGSKYKIVLDNGNVINTYEEVILNNGLLYHKFISDDLMDKIAIDTNYYRSYHKALDLINKKQRSEEEIKAYLKKNNIEENDIDLIVSNLKGIGLIDDRKFAISYTNDKINLSNDGPGKIRKFLENNKIEEEYIYEAINNIDKDIVYAKIDKLINKKVKLNNKYSNSLLKQKILYYLINLGYSREDILDRLDKVKLNNIDLSSQMDKIFNKFSKKYSDSDLYYKVKNKLYSLGYSKEEIENYLIKK